MGVLDRKRIASLATDGVEQVELTEPREAVTRAGATAELLSAGSPDRPDRGPSRKGDDDASRIEPEAGTAVRQNVKGRSTMTKAELAKAVS